MNNNQNTHYVYSEFRVHSADFFNIDLANDNKFFLNPYEIELLDDPIAKKATTVAIDFFETIRKLLLEGKCKEAESLFCSHLSESGETCFGYAQSGVDGTGIRSLAKYVLDNLYSDKILLQGIKRIEDIKLFIPSISNDRVSDLYTNVIRGVLLEYTQEQCRIYGYPMKKGKTRPFWDAEAHDWVTIKNEDIFVWKGKTKLLVPKSFVRRDTYNNNRFNSFLILPDYIEKELDKQDSGLVRKLKNGRRIVTKKEMKQELIRCKVSLDKNAARNFLHLHPNCITIFRQTLEERRKKRNKQKGVN